MNTKDKIKKKKLIKKLQKILKKATKNTFSAKCFIVKNVFVSFDDIIYSDEMLSWNFSKKKENKVKVQEIKVWLSEDR